MGHCELAELLREASHELVRPRSQYARHLHDRLESAAASLEAQEPVGRVKTVGGYPDDSEHTVEWLCKYKDLKDGDLLYTTPQQGGAS